MQQITHKYQGGALAGGQGGDASSTSTTPSIWPVSGTITSNFGYRGNPIGGGSGFHEGIDIGVDYGTPVRATAAGKVTMPVGSMVMATSLKSTMAMGSLPVMAITPCC